MLDRNALHRVYAAHVTDGAPTPDDHLAGLEAVAKAVRAEQAEDLRASEWKRKNAEHGAECARAGERRLVQVVREACDGLGITEDEPQSVRVRLLRERLDRAEAARVEAEQRLAEGKSAHLRTAEQMAGYVKALSEERHRHQETRLKYRQLHAARTSNGSAPEAPVAGEVGTLVYVCERILENATDEDPRISAFDWGELKTAVETVSESILESRARQPQPAADRPGLRRESLGETGDAVSICEGCDEERDEPHTWKDCAARLRKERDAAIDAGVAARVTALPGDLRLPLRIGTADHAGEAAFIGDVRALANVVEELVRREIERSAP